MKLFNWIKNLFKKGITLSQPDTSKLVFLSSSQKVKLGTKIEVPENFVAVVVYKNKVADTFAQGTHRLEISNLPLLTRYAKLLKPNKNGNLPVDFKAGIYYLNLSIFEDEHFDDSAKLLVKDKNFKSFFVGFEGKFTYSIFEPIDFFEAMLTQYGIIKNQIAKNEISYWISLLVVKKIKKNKPNIYELLEKNSTCFEGLCDYINKDIADCGVKVEKIEITKVNLPKRIYKKFNYDFSENKEHNLEIAEANQDNVEKLDSASNKEIESKSDELIQYDNNIKEHVEEQNQQLNNQYEKQNTSISQNLDINNLSKNFDAQDFDINIHYYDDKIKDMNNKTEDEYFEKETSKQIDNEILQDDTNRFDTEKVTTIQYKQCLNCGALNSMDSNICFNCKTELK